MNAAPSMPPRSGVLKIGAEDPAPQTSPFLLLPGEVRNRIYAYLFIHAGRIVVPDEQFPHAPKAAVAGINLLSSCQQIHSEATGIFYNGNEFTISGHSGECNDHEHRPISQLGSWLKSIGKWRNSLSRISVDLSTACMSNYNLWLSTTARIDLSVIMEQSGMHPTHNPIIAFLPNASGPSGTLQLHWVSITALNALLHQLKGFGTSALDTCVRWRSRCHYIDCNAAGTEISFGLYACAPIVLSKTTGGTFERKIVQAGPRNFDSLKEHKNIVERIFGTSKDATGTFVVNINDRTISPFRPATYQVNQQFRIWTFIHNRDKFVARCSMQNKVVSPRIFKDLERWVLNGRLMWFLGPKEIRTYRISSNVLRLEIGSLDIDAKSLTCFDAIAFLWATLGLSDRVKIGIDCGHSPAIENDPLAVTVTLYRLRRRVLHFLEFLAKLPPHLRTPATPVIWMDELCNVRFATFRPNRGGLITIQNEDPGWDPPKAKSRSVEEVRRLGRWSRSRLQRAQRHQHEKKLKLDGKEVRQKRLRKTLCGTLRLLKEYLREIYGDV